MTRIITLLFVLFAFATTAFAATPLKGSSLGIDFPSSWKVDTSDDTIAASPADESLMLLFMVLEADQLDAAMKVLDKELSALVKDFKGDEEPTEIKLNGMDGITVDGTGTIEGTPVELGLIMLVTPKGKVVLGMGFAEKGKFDKHEATLEMVFKSIKPMK